MLLILFNCQYKCKSVFIYLNFYINLLEVYNDVMTLHYYIQAL